MERAILYIVRVEAVCGKILKENGDRSDKVQYYTKKNLMKRFLSGITPSGDGSLHIGNYLGAVSQFIDLSRTNEAFLMVADLHALTTVQQKARLSGNIESLILNELALLAGEGALDRITFFRQSDVPMHTELQSILNNVTPLGLLKRAHAYKDKLAKDVMEDDINVGLFSYPMLMAADILLYNADFVPVGKDQKQHIEIARDIAERFNRIFGKKVFTLPEPQINDSVAVILGTDGQRKMSKSLGNIISIFEDETVIKKQVNATFTDPTRKHATDPGHVEGNMVFSYLEHFGEKERVEEYKEAYSKGKVGDAELKEYLFSSLLQHFAPAREAYSVLKSDPKKVATILAKGREKATDEAIKTMTAVREAMGLTTAFSHYSYPKSGKEGVIAIDEFAKIEMRVGKVVDATHPEKSEKLIRLTVNFGVEKRIIFTGVRGYGYSKDDFIGKQFFFVTNLLPRKMMGEESQGMILAVDGEELSFGEHADKKPLFISAEGLPVGAKIR